MKNKIIKLIDKIQQAWNSLLYKLMFNHCVEPKEVTVRAYVVTEWERKKRKKRKKRKND